MTAPVMSRRVGSCTPICARPAPSTSITIAPRADDITDPASACQAGATNDDGRDRLELEAHAGIGIGGREPAGLRDRGHARQRACKA